MKKAECYNCDGRGLVSVSIKCPDCQTSGFLEIDELRRLADLMRRNYRERTRSPQWLEDALNRINLSQRKDPWHGMK